jgi:hypothetical protein
MLYNIIIPSFKREKTLIKKTLKALQKTDVWDCIELGTVKLYVFVASVEEKIVYEQEIKSAKNLNEVVIKVVVGVRGIPNQRNYIQKYFKLNERLLFIDDDISRIKGIDKCNKVVNATRLHSFILSAFKQTEKLKIKMWGINSTVNPREMKQTVSFGRIYIVGNFYGLINTDKVFVDTGDWIKTRKHFKAGKESHERALKMYDKFGGVLKYRAFGVVSKYWGEPGGHQISRNEEGEKDATMCLHKKYPHATKVRIYKGFYDLQIKPQTKVFKTNYVQL